MGIETVDALILNYNDAVTTKDCAERLQKYDIIRRILIVDNNSTDDSYNQLSKLSSDKIETVSTGRNGGYGAGNNYGIRYLREKYASSYILLCNPDTIIEEETIDAMESFLKAHLDYAIVAPFMLNPKGEKQYITAFRIPEINEYIASLGIVMNKLRKSFAYPDILNVNSEFVDVGAVSGALFMMDAEKMVHYGMYDESIFLYCEELSLGIKLEKNGLKTALLPQKTFIHYHSVSINKSLKSNVKKQQQLMESKLYVIKNIYHANMFQNRIAFLLSQLSIAEVWFLSVLRGRA